MDQSPNRKHLDSFGQFQNQEFSMDSVHFRVRSISGLDRLYRSICRVSRMHRMVDHNRRDDKIEDIFHNISILHHQDRLHNIHDSSFSNLKYLSKFKNRENVQNVLFDAFDCFLSGAGGAIRA